MSLGDNIKKIREQKNISQYALAKTLGISQQSVAQWETGKTNPRRKMIDKLANTLNVTPNELFGYNEHTEEINNTTLDKLKKDEYDSLAHSNLPSLNKRDKRDIRKVLDELVNDLDGKGAVAFYNGDEALDDATRELIAQSLKVSAVIAKQRAKEKFTPKKYKRSDENGYKK